MSGHSKWATIKRKKGAKDAKRGQVFTKLIKELTVLARVGGGDLSSNARLRLAVESAKAQRMPKDNIERAIKKGTGELEGEVYEEYIYEGYGPGGVAVLVEAVTDNKNRTTAELRHLITKNNGNLGESGCVSWIFSKKGMFSFERGKVDEDGLMELALELGADDIVERDDEIDVIVDPKDFESVKKEIESKNYTYTLAEITMVPKTVVKLDSENAQKMLRLMEALEEHDDVQHVYANFDIPENVMDAAGE